ncbi:hypothetical protein [uncultured Ruminococcus sp.]|uniref:hypothetical protein n=1 Tax=uncultured Ruminococcus sp. TaxID=165186 RepID=UPI0026284D6E|nr:hypothetical protein [uncultured Ruminococcus sp.]
MIKEEYSFHDINDYLFENINLLIVGFPKKEERCTFFSNLWRNKHIEIMYLKLYESEYVHIRTNQNKELKVDLCVGLPRILKSINISEKNVLLDISSLDNVLVMFLTKQLLTKNSPNSFFASYIRPEKYYNESENIGFDLCQQIGAINAVPGFAKRESTNQTLCAFLGFEGVRLKGILETVQSFDRLIPIVAFPSGTPQWYNVAMWNSMDILQSEGKNLSVYKCYSESIFDAFDLLSNTIAQDETVVLAPLGTRPHSMACAIFACHHEATRIIYDFVVENDNRAIGISDITIYHLSSFIKS